MLDESAPVDSPSEASLSGGHAQFRTKELALSVMDGRPGQFTQAECETALLELGRKAGAATEAISSRVDESFCAIRSELNALAGGQASARVMLLAHHAQRTELALELATSTTSVAHGAFVLGQDKLGQTDKALRNVVGIAAFATDLLNKAYEAAQAEGKALKAKVGPAEELMSRLGVTPATGESSEVGPLLHGGGGSTLGPPPPKPPTSSRKKTP